MRLSAVSGKSLPAQAFDAHFSRDYGNALTGPSRRAGTAFFMTEPTLPEDPGDGNRIRIRNLRAASLNAQGLSAALPAGFNGRWTRRHWAHASLFAMLGTLVMAIVPGFSNAMSTSAAQASADAPYMTTSLLLPPLPASSRRAAHVEQNNWQQVT